MQTITGPVSSDDLGVTYMHEHVFVLSVEMQAGWPGYNGWDEDREVEKARAKLAKLRQRGCDTIVDPTVVGLGRNIRAVTRALEGTGLRLIAATGLYTFAYLPLAFSLKTRADKLAKLVDLLLSDVYEGLEGTAIRPGVLKCATDLPGLTEDVEIVLRAVARVHRETGLPIVTHTHSATRRGLDQIEVFADEGVDMRSVLIGHCNESSNLEYLEELLASGAFIGFDRCGKVTPTVSLDQQLDNLAELLRRGYGGQIMLSHDHVSFLDWFEPGEMEARPSYWPYGYVDVHLRPGLESRGITRGEVNRMLIENPRGYFGRAGELIDTTAGDRDARR